MNKRKILGVLMAALMLFTACSTGKAGVVATVDGVDIPQEKFDAHYRIQRSSIVQYMGEEALEEKHPEDDFNRSFGEIIRSQVLDSLIQDQVMINAATEDGMTTETQAEDIVQEEMEYAGEEYFNEILEEMGLDLDQYTSMVNDAIVVQEYREKKMAEIEVSKEEIAEYYEANKEALEQVEVSHILVETEEEAENVLKRLENGEDFGELAMELSTDQGSASQGGSYGYITRDVNFVPEFLETAFALGVDEVSDPVETEHGYHIIKVTDKIDDLESSSAQITEILQAEKFHNLLEDMVNKAKVKKHIDLSKEPESIQKEIENTEDNDVEEPEVEIEEIDEEDLEDTEEEDPEETEEP